MEKLKFYLNKSVIAESDKLLWEKGEKLPRIKLSQYNIIEGSIDEIEEYIVNFLKKSFTEIREATKGGTFEEASIIMPSLQMVSKDQVDIIDMNIEIGDDNISDLESIMEEISNQLVSDLDEEELSGNGEGNGGLEIDTKSVDEISEIDEIRKNLL